MSVIRLTEYTYSMLRYIVKEDDCWIWRGYINPDGYGMASVGGCRKLAHRVVYAAFEGEIPEGLQLDHLCRNRDCVNPLHLEPVTAVENVRRSLSKYK